MVLSEDIIFVSLGMVVLDELRFPDGQVLHNVGGGSALYSTLGARMSTTGAARPEKVGCLILAGSDFPDSVSEGLRDWDISLLVAKDDTRLSSRGLLQYRGENFKERVFAYTTPPLQPTPADLQSSPLIQSTAFHFLASPELLESFVSQATELRSACAIALRPMLVWEPAPPSCISASQDAQLRAARLVDVYSPNHIEFLAIFRPNSDGSPTEFNQAIIEAESFRVLASGVGEDGNGAVVIRCGEHGSLVSARSYPLRWFPAFHRRDSTRVVDATGAGNAFLGGFTVSFGETADYTEAAITGSVAASFAIEQVGLPRRGSLDGREVWNGEEFYTRVQRYRAILASTAR